MNFDIKEHFRKEYEIQSKMSLKKDDVFGIYDTQNGFITNGLVVARKQGDKCPVFKDILGFKEITTVCSSKQYNEVCYWLDYIGHEIIEHKEINYKKIAIRSCYSAIYG